MFPARENAPKTAKDGLEEICKRERYAFFTSDQIYQIVRRKLACVVVAVPKAYYSKAVSLVMKKGSQFKRLFVHQ
jgi:hypothetical protein